MAHESSLPQFRFEHVRLTSERGLGQAPLTAAAQPLTRRNHRPPQAPAQVPICKKLTN